jgi:hypothetical protein
MCVLGRNQRCVLGFDIVATENTFFIFQVPKQVFCEAGTQARTRG